MRATVGRLRPSPGGTNVIASVVDLWLDARGPDAGATAALVVEITDAAGAAAAVEGCRVEVTEESASGAVHFDAALRARLSTALGGADGVPVLPTGAGHDAAVLAAVPGSRRIPTGMLFVRNPTGVSHSPAEFAEAADCEHGGTALAVVLRDLLS
jgi:N-carbamoyl-L-amino-acid hydrolase